MDTIINNTSRALCVEDFILVPGKPQHVKDAKSLLAATPRLAGLVKVGEVTVRYGTKAQGSKTPNLDEAQAQEPVSANIDEVETSEPVQEERPTTRRKRG